jgi:hypothetical protein
MGEKDRQEIYSLIFLLQDFFLIQTGQQDDEGW